MQVEPIYFSSSKLVRQSLTESVQAPANSARVVEKESWLSYTLQMNNPTVLQNPSTP